MKCWPNEFSKPSGNYYFFSRRNIGCAIPYVQHVAFLPSYIPVIDANLLIFSTCPSDTVSASPRCSAGRVIGFVVFESTCHRHPFILCSFEYILSCPRVGGVSHIPGSTSRPANLENVFRGTFRVKKRDLPAKNRDSLQGPH